MGSGRPYDHLRDRVLLQSCAVFSAGSDYRRTFDSPAHGKYNLAFHHVHNSSQSEKEEGKIVPKLPKTLVERPKERRPTDIYYQDELGAPFLFVSRHPDAEPLAVVRELAAERGTTPRIVRNLWDCDLWSFEGLDRPYRIATVWRALGGDGKIPPPRDALEVEE